ncbi:MAG: hypothetical protein AVDCRST_MAG77-423, partial [uncultured Chloroflexi bacterium]
ARARARHSRRLSPRRPLRRHSRWCWRCSRHVRGCLRRRYRRAGRAGPDRRARRAARRLHHAAWRRPAAHAYRPSAHPGHPAPPGSPPSPRCPIRPGRRLARLTPDCSFRRDPPDAPRSGARPPLQQL